jgi:hypothetical protein
MAFPPASIFRARSPVCMPRPNGRSTRVQASRGSGLVSGRDHQHGHRPGPDHRHAAAAGAFRRGDCRARPADCGAAHGLRHSPPGPVRSHRCACAGYEEAGGYWHRGGVGAWSTTACWGGVWPGRHRARAVGVGSKYKWAGKTGTAQVIAIKQNEKYHANLTRCAIAITPGSSPLPRPMIRRSRCPCWWRTADSAPSARRAHRAQGVGCLSVGRGGGRARCAQTAAAASCERNRPGYLAQGVIDGDAHLTRVAALQEGLGR